MSVLVEPIVRPCPETEGDDSDAERTREWLVSNGLGGYASGTVCGVPTRRYHGLLVAVLPTPLGRMMMLDRLNERLGLPDGSFAPIGVEALVGRPIPDVSGRLTKFHLEAGLPVWRYAVGGVTLEKRLLLPHLQNTVYLTYRLIEGDGAGSRGACFRGAEPGLMAQSSVRRIAGHRLAAGGVRRRTSLGDILLHVLPKVRGQQYRVRWDVRARLTRGLEAPIDHRPLTRHPPPTTGYQSPTPFSSFRVPQGGISD